VSLLSPKGLVVKHRNHGWLRYSYHGFFFFLKAIVVGMKANLLPEKMSWEVSECDSVVAIF
jgi:hypothetical protein